LQPIQAGTPFRDIVETNGAARLTEIRRQSTDWQRDASHELAKGQTVQALQRYSDHEAVHHGESRDQAIAKLVQDYMADCKTNGTASRLAFAHRRADVHAINQAIKASRMAKGETPVETLFNTDHGPRAFAPGDRILFTRNDATLGVRNGMLGTVKTVGDTQLSVCFDANETENGRNLTFSPKEFPSIDHGFAVSIHRSQGCTVDRSFVLSSRTLDENLTYVAMTRHKEKASFYMAQDIAPKQFIHLQEPKGTNDFKPRAPSRSR
jgi:ATP-dependent exoDNAse (exonuclease V) alpha subunit